MSEELAISSTAFFSTRARRECISRALPEPETARYGAEDVAFAARAWTMRAEEEHRSAATFSALGHALVRAGEPLDIAEAALSIALDELGHAALCTELARRLGAPPPRRHTSHGVPGRDDAPRRVALSLWLVEGAIGETISSALFARGRNLAIEPCTRAALGRILRDEVMHARTAWEALGALCRAASDADRDWLQEETRRAFRVIEETQMVPVLRRLEKGDRFEGVWAELGVLPPEQRVEVFYGAIELRIRRELGKLGVDFTAAWERRYR